MTMTASKIHDQDAEFLSSQTHHVGHILLNRSKALNSLNVELIRGISQALKDWKSNPHIKSIVIEGNGEKAFCAGGDIRSVYYAREHNQWDLMDEIFRKEYEMNYAISCYPKPYIALIHGICMGGGMGISVHGKYRIVTDNTLMAMPETTIGFFPDIGASYFLNQCPGEIGMFLGLLGERIQAGDAIYCGLATHYVPFEDWLSFKGELLRATGEEDILRIIEKYQRPSVSEKLVELKPLIDQIFEGDDFETILHRLQVSSDPVVQKWYEDLLKKSPTSVKVSFQLLRRAKGLSLREALIQEYRLSQACMRNHDFFEGVRALLIDKDNAPQWQPSQLDQVTQERVDSYFQSLGDKELVLS